jgi:dTDP-4-dehydrorhamnose 3,5-epimerase
MVQTFEIEGLLLFTPKKFKDERGFFSETYSKKNLASLGFEKDFVQDNQSFSTEKGVVRGLHFQTRPYAQDKLVRVIQGRILDVAVDIRTGSPTYGQHVAVELSAQNWQQFLIPVGFAHGFCTLEANTEVFYKVTNPYAPEYDKGLAFDDPALAIDWGIDRKEATLSKKDRNLPKLSQLPDYFSYSI